MTNTYSNQNNIYRQKLADLIRRLSGEQLSQPMEAGWTVAGVLAHLAFWDQRALILLQKWQHVGIGPSDVDTDIINDATRILCVSLSPQVAAQLALTTAEAIDQEIERLAPDFLARVERDGKTVRLDRARHRETHIGEIEKALGL